MAFRKFNPSSFLGFLVGAVGLLTIGFFVGRMGFPLSADSAPSSAANSLASQKSNYSSSSRPANSAPSHRKALSTRDAVAVKELLASLDDFPPSPHRQDFLKAMLREWAQHDPEAALAYAQVNFPGEEEFLTAVYQGWAIGEPSGAWMAVQSAGTPAIAAVLEAVAENSPESLAPFLSEMDITLDLNDPEPLGPTFVNGVRALIGKGFTEEAIRVSSQVQEVEFRRESFQAIVLGLLEEEVGEERATEVLLSFPSEEDRVAAATAVGLMMAEETPDGAVAWAATLPDGSGSRKAALYQSVTEWFERDFYSATDWMNQNADDPDLNELVTHVAVSEKMIFHTPDISMEWVESIHDPAARLDGIVQVAGTWAESDPDSALQFIAASETLSPQEKISARQYVEEVIAEP